ncbi:MAG: TolC family protein [Fusobacterium perfoetens]|uniref:TolC family protein n=1 Tax=Fusobacterium perfoetens TaxID=852 RepID=UPI0023F431B6|nr:TolC family protein [Fusobacterium perfoetens]MCI6152326.1 TolC family protein [Fusobacterium perfoetens]MDY3238184.1 TolC family protein [Fusobacterium perfoetens]
MKKKMILFLLIQALAFSEEITLDEMLNILDKTSYQNKIYNIQNQIDNDTEKYHKLGDFNGIVTTVDSNYSDVEDEFQTTGRLEYGPFYLEGIKNYNTDDEIIYGVEKNIKDIIYSSDKNQLKKLEYTKNINNLEYRKNIENQKIQLINLYEEYINNYLGIKIKENGIKTLEKEEEKMSKAYSLGAVAKIELDSIKCSINNLKIEIQVLKNNLENIKKIFSYNFAIEIGEKTLKEIIAPKINIDEYINNYGEKDIEILEKQKSILEEDIKYMNYTNNMPDISIGLEHSNRYDENRVVLKFSKSLFDLDLDLETGKNNLSQQEIEIEQKKSENNGEKLQIYNTYDEYMKNYIVNKNNSELELSKYNVKKLEYSLGKVDYLEVMESFNNYLNYEIESEKAKNNLNGYIYEIMIRGEKK